MMTRIVYLFERIVFPNRYKARMAYISKAVTKEEQILREKIFNKKKRF